MSLADLYKDNLNDSGSGSEGEEDEYVPDNIEDDDGTDDDQAGEEDPADDDKTPELTEAAAQDKKRRIDSIWEEMNAPSERPAKAAKPQPSEPSTSTSANEDCAQPVATDKPKPAAPPPRRRASKFSKIAEMVEQRRAKKENTLDKARREWSGFVAKEGIRDDLDKANKDG
ncbi:hypothetical protein FBU59_002286 [Linderina macrospora]|uniref:Uncharacterized protein n=1 Tax=Linderina macrospora TaxID=4868 RepID=A0ACC1JBR6_9FUNG|nr:hypothetical protein FBU59_002286 [Linderina macrospora]